MGYVYSTATGRYRDTLTGRLVSEKAVRAAVDQVADAASDRLADLTERLLGGDLALAAWQRQAMVAVKTAHLAAGIVAQGGKAQANQAFYGFLGQRIRQEYAWFRDLARGLEDGSIPLDQRLIARAGMYGQASRTTFNSVVARGQQGRGYVSERNILGSSEHCPACRAESDRGWVPIGSLSIPGTRTCLGNCHCRLAYSMEAAVAA